MVSNFVLSAAPRYDTAIDGRLVLKADQDALKQETHPQVQFSLVPWPVFFIKQHHCIEILFEIILVRPSHVMLYNA